MVSSHLIANGYVVYSRNVAVYFVNAIHHGNFNDNAMQLNKTTMLITNTCRKKRVHFSVGLQLDDGV